MAAPMMDPNQSTWASVAEKPEAPLNPQPNPATQKWKVGNISGPTADPHCLIIQVHPPITANERPNGIETRTKINNLLAKKGVAQSIRVMAVGYSGVV